MHRWFEPSAAGLMLFGFFLAFQALCGDTAKTTATSNIVENIGDEPAVTVEAMTTFGAPVVLERQVLETTGAPLQTGYRIRWPSLAGVVLVGWTACMALGRLMLDGGVPSRAARTLLPPRRHPALWLLAYLAAIPLLALPGVLIDMLHNGVRGLASPDGPSAYPLLVLTLVFFGLPVVAIFLAVRRVLDRRIAARLFETNATPKADVEWPF
jgi:hypothetical protein